jgi:hypothetical protein
MERFDHLVYATPALDATAEELERLLGVRPATGGRHPGEGTRNAILALGPKCYLEVVGPDAEPPVRGGLRWFEIDRLRSPRLVAWAVRDAALQHAADLAARAGFPLGPVGSASRVLPNGQRLTWRFTHPRVLAAGGVVPFFIDWGAGSHPAEGAPGGVRLSHLRAEHPEAERVAELLRLLGLEVAVTRGERPRLVATLETRGGSVELS